MNVRLMLALAAAAMVAALVACGGDGDDGNSDDGQDGDDEVEFRFDSEVVYEGDAPSAIAFAPNGRIFFAERNSGSIRVIDANGSLLEEPFANVAPATGFEWGLLGLALDPQFGQNGYVYAYYTEPVQAEPPTVRPLLVRYTDNGNQGTDPTVIISDLPETHPEHPYYHAGSNIGFGPDGYLYVAVGDYDVRDNAQDLSVPMGKILRVNKEDGSPAPDNPFVDDENADPRIFAYGFRKPYDFAFHPETGEMYAPDNNPATCDELNVVEAGNNYGWPMTDEFRFDDCTAGQETIPIHFFAREGLDALENLSTVFPTGVDFLTGGLYPDLEGSLLVCESTTMLLRALVLEGPQQDTVASDEAIAGDCFFTVAASPDGVIYYGTQTQLKRIPPPEAGPAAGTDEESE